MSWLIFAFATPFLFSLTNFIDKFLIEKRIKDPIGIVILGGFISGIFGIAIALFHGFVLLNFFQTFILLISGILLVLYLIPYFKALSLDDPSRVVPLFQVVPLIVLFVSSVILHEQLTNMQLAGFFITMIAGFFLGTEKADTGFLKPRPSFWYMMLSSVLYALIGILFKFALVPDNFWLTFSYQSMGAGVGAAGLLLVPNIRKTFAKEVKQLKKDVWGIFFINKLFEFFADLAYSFAVTLVPVALVTVVGSVQWFFLLVEGIILSLWFPHIVKEDIRKQTIGIKLVAIVFIFIGIYLLSF